MGEAKRRGTFEERVAKAGITEHELARIRAGVALASSLAMVLPPSLDGEFAYSAISSFHENREPFITLTVKQDARLIEKLGLSYDDIAPTGRFVCAVREGIWIGFMHGVRGEGAICLTITFFDEELIRTGYGPKMLQWFKDREHKLHRDDIGSIFDMCNHVFVSGQGLPSPLPAIDRLELKLMVDPGEGGPWAPSKGGNT